MSNLYTPSKKEQLILNNKFNNNSKYRNITNNHITQRNKIRWKNRLQNNLPLYNWRQTLYSYNSNNENNNHDTIPDEVLINRRKTTKGYQYYVKKLSKKHKKIMATKLRQKSETKKEHKLRKLDIKKRILNNIIFVLINGDEVKLGDYYKDHADIPNNISNKKIKKIVLELFNNNYKLDLKKLFLNEEYINFSINFKKDNIYDRRKTPLKIIALL